MSLATRRVVIACFCAAALAAVGCADGSVNPVSPSASPAVSSLAATSFPRSGALHVTKECRDYRAGPGSSHTSMPASTSRRLRTESIGTGQGRYSFSPRD